MEYYGILWIMMDVQSCSMMTCGVLHLGQVREPELRVRQSFRFRIVLGSGMQELHGVSFRVKLHLGHSWV